MCSSDLKRVAEDWRLIADLSFADLAIWVESKSGNQLAAAQVRAATAATVFPKDFVGDEVTELFKGEDVDYFPIKFNGVVLQISLATAMQMRLEVRVA